MSEWKDIWDHEAEGLTDDLLQAYLNGTLSKEEERRVELMISQEGMESDAMDGLKQMDRKETHASVHRLHKNLSSLTQKKKHRTRKLPNQTWLWLSVLCVLLLVLMAFAVYWYSKPH